MMKLLAMILMASITLPVAAKEVTLKCTLSGEDSEIWVLDEAAGTVARNDRILSVKTDCNDNDHKDMSCWKAFITPTKFGHQIYIFKAKKGEDREIQATYTINRDGDASWVNGGSLTKGTCSLFKAAF